MDPTPAPSKVILSYDLLKSLKLGKVFSRSSTGPDGSTESLSGQVNSLDFSADGHWLLASADDNRLALYDVLNAKARENNKTGGCRSARFVPPTSNSALYLTRGGQSIALLDIAADASDNYVLCDRVSHWKNVSEYETLEGEESGFTDLAVHPTGKVFLSVGGALTKAVQLWETRRERRPFAQLRIRTDTSPTVSFDPSGLVFAVGFQERPHGQCIKLFDLRKYGQGPFLSAYFASHGDPRWLSFSRDGRYMMWSTSEELTEKEDNSSILRVCDARTLWEVRKVVIPPADREGSWGKESVQPEAGFTSDSQYVFSGHGDTRLRFWPVHSSVKSDEPVEKPLVELRGHALLTDCVKWNPQYPILASACQNICLWRPDHPSMRDLSNEQRPE